MIVATTVLAALTTWAMWTLDLVRAGGPLPVPGRQLVVDVDSTD